MGSNVGLFLHVRTASESPIVDRKSDNKSKILLCGRNNDLLKNLKLTSQQCDPSKKQFFKIFINDVEMTTKPINFQYGRWES